MQRATLAVIIAAVTSAWAATTNGPVTFTKDVLPILQENCQTCHRPAGINMSGMVAPMSLITYEEVRPWAKALGKVVESRQMPPWDATPETSKIYRNCPLMSEAEVATIKQWVETGARKGNPEDAPAPLQWTSTGWNFGEPDLVMSFPEPFLVADDVADLYQNITVTLSEDQLSEDRWIKATEFKPGSEVVHHIIGYAVGPNDAAESSGGGETTRGMIGGNAPGTDFAQYPDGYGILLQRGSKVTFAMHYHKEAGPGTAKWDSSQIGIKFHDKDSVIDHPVEIASVAHGAFEIPPHNGNWRVGAMKRFDDATMLMGLMPHMHLRGKAAKYTAHYPNGSSELLLDVPKYNFNWQRSYDLAEYKFIPAGTYLEMDFAYDNSDERAKEVGFDSNKAIRFGGPTTDEMDLAWYFASPATQTDIAQHEAGDRHAAVETGDTTGD